MALPSIADARPSRMYQESRGTILDDQDMSAAAAARTSTAIHTEGFSTLILSMYFTYNAGTSIQIVYCEGTGDYDFSSTVDWSNIMALVSIDSTGTAQYRKFDAVFNDDGSDLAGDFDATVTIGVAGHKYVRCVFDVGGTPTGDDKLTVRAAVSTP